MELMLRIRCAHGTQNLDVLYKDRLEIQDFMNKLWKYTDLFN